MLNRMFTDRITIPLRRISRRFLADPPVDEKARLKGAWLVLVMALCFAFSAGVRLKQVHDWKSAPTEHYVEGIPLMVTHDAYLWLRWAKYDRQLRWNEDQGVDVETAKKEFSTAPIPMLSLVLSWLSHTVGADVYTTALYLIPFLSSLFILPLIAYFNRFGEPLGGTLGALMTTSAFEYMSRTCVGCIDTDALNLFFPLLSAFFILRAATGSSGPLRVLDAALAGITMRVFDWWYAHPYFSTVYLIVLAATLIFRRVPFRWIMACLAAFALCASTLRITIGFSSLLDHLHLYSETSHALPSASSDLFLPNTLSVIAETRHLSFVKTLNLIVKNPLISGLGLSLCALFAIPLWKNFLPMAPLAAVGLMSFIGGRRFAMYLAPFAGIGYGLLISTAARFLANRFPERTCARFARPAAWGMALVFFAAIVPVSAIPLRPNPPFSPRYYEAALALGRTLPRGSWIWNYWDYGLLLRDVTNLNVYSDGRTPWSAANYFMARSYTSPSPSEMRRIIAYVHSHLDKLTDVAFLPERLGELPRDESKLTDPVYVLFDYHMLPYFSAIYSLGAWDFKTGIEPYPGYRNPKCVTRPDGKLQCDQLTISLNDGTVNGNKGLLRRSALIQGGRATKASTYGDTGWTLEFVMDERGKIIFTLLLTEDLYQSNFNQMFILGQYDQNLFEEIDNRFPYARTFKVKPDPL